jgi:enamine deaminase RidA (YjgF/YER057c/UK114 family)
VLPKAPRPLGAYVEASEVGSLLLLSGMLPVVDGKLPITGRLGENLSVEQGREAVRIAAMNALAVAQQHLGDLDRIKKLVKLGVILVTTEQFVEHAAVADGASKSVRSTVRRRKRSSADCVRCSKSANRPTCHRGGHLRDQIMLIKEAARISWLIAILETPARGSISSIQSGAPREYRASGSDSSQGVYVASQGCLDCSQHSPLRECHRPQGRGQSKTAAGYRS